MQEMLPVVLESAGASKFLFTAVYNPRLDCTLSFGQISQKFIAYCVCVIFPDSSLETLDHPGVK